MTCRTAKKPSDLPDLGSGSLGSPLGRGTVPSKRGKPTERELDRERHMAEEPAEPMGFGARWHQPVRYDE